MNKNSENYSFFFIKTLLIFVKLFTIIGCEKLNVTEDKEKIKFIFLYNVRKRHGARIITKEKKFQYKLESFYWICNSSFFVFFLWSKGAGRSEGT